MKDRNTGEWIPFKPYDYQIETAYKILRNRYCMAEVATSGGKSLVISIIMFYILKHLNPEAKFLIIVPSITLVTQFYENIMEYNYGFNFLAKYGDKIDFRENKIDEIVSILIKIFFVLSKLYSNFLQKVKYNVENKKMTK